MSLGERVLKRAWEMVLVWNGKRQTALGSGRFLHVVILVKSASGVVQRVAGVAVCSGPRWYRVHVKSSSRGLRIPFWNSTCQSSTRHFFFFFKSLLSLLQYCFSFVYCFFFGLQACGILPPRSGIEPTPPALEGKVITSGLLRKSLLDTFSFSVLL